MDRTRKLKKANLKSKTTKNITKKSNENKIRNYKNSKDIGGIDQKQ